MTPPVGLTIFIHLLVIGALRVLRLFGFKVLIPSYQVQGGTGRMVLSVAIMVGIGLFLLYVVSNIMILAITDKHATWRLLWGG